VNNEDILDRLRAMLILGLELQIDGVPDKTPEEKDSLIRQIESLTVHMKDIIQVLDYIVTVMREDRPHSDEECDTFELACNYLFFLFFFIFFFMLKLKL
jgi:hypothetical protein